MLGGAAYLFLVNSYFIFFSSAVVLAILNIPKVRDLTEKEWKRFHIRMIRNTIIVFLSCIPIGIFINR